MSLIDWIQGLVRKADNWNDPISPVRPETLAEAKGFLTPLSFGTSPSPTPVPQLPQNILSAPVKPTEGVTQDQALPIIQKIVSGYMPKTPDVPQGWQSPMNDYINLLADLSAQYGLDPRLLPLLAISETQNLRPQASGTTYNNPFNVMEPGTQQLHMYPDIETGIRQYASGVGEPRYSAFKERLKPNSTFEDFVKIQNPVDNPQQQLDLLLQLAEQLGVGGDY